MSCWDCSDIFWTVWKYFELSGDIFNCLDILNCPYTFELSGHVSNCTDTFEIVRTHSKYDQIYFKLSVHIVLTELQMCMTNHFPILLININTSQVDCAANTQHKYWFLQQCLPLADCVCWTASSIAQMEVLFPTLQKQIIFFFFFFRGP